MIKFEQNGNVVTAKFVKEGYTLRAVWEDSLYNLAQKYLYGTYWANHYFTSDVIDKVMKDRTIVGIAKCHPHDEFDFETGKTLAKKDLLNRFELAKNQLKREILYMLRHDVSLIKDKM